MDILVEEKDLIKMIEVADTDHDGKITEEEFYMFMCDKMPESEWTHSELVRIKYGWMILILFLRKQNWCINRKNIPQNDILIYYFTNKLLNENCSLIICWLFHW